MRGFRFGRELRHCCYKGGGGSGGSGKGKSGGGGGGGASEAPPKEAALPEGVEQVANSNNSAEYRFSVGGQKVYMTLKPSLFASGDAEVSFAVGNKKNLDRGKLEGRDGVKAALMLRRTMEYDASRRPDGFIYSALAYDGDGAGVNRAKAYTRMGFSQSKGAGEFQYAIVRNGKLEPYNL